MSITLSDAACKYMRRKQEIYRKSDRKPRLILVARSCKGAEFRLVYEVPKPDDSVHIIGDCELYIAPALLDEYGGFSLDTELFFFAQRLVVQPKMQTYKCDCKQKCNKEER